MTSSQRKLLLKYTAGAAFLGALGWLLAKNEALATIPQTLQRVPVSTTFGALGLFAAARLVQAASLRQSLSIFGEALTFGTALNLVAIKGFYNLTFGGAGLIAQATKGKVEEHFGMRGFLGATLLQSAMLVGALVISILAVLMLLSHQPPSSQLALASGATGVAICLGVIALLRNTRPRRCPPESNRLRRAAHDIHGLFRSATTGDLLMAGFYQALFIWLRVARLALIVGSLKAGIGFTGISAIVLAADLASVIPLTPGGIGLREFVIGGGASLVGHMEILVAASLIDRGVTILGNFAHGLVVSLRDLAQKKRQ